MKKTKTYILTLSRTFPKGHPREGEETEFAYSFMKALYTEYHRNDDFHSEYSKPHKIHTIRTNYELWKKRIDEVNAGKAVLSVRQWLGAPRHSKQRELFRLDRDSGVGVERLRLDSKHIETNFGESDFECYWIHNDSGKRHVVIGGILAGHDGLMQKDWEAWFSDPRYDRTQPMAIIHFTSFRYCR